MVFVEGRKRRDIERCGLVSMETSETGETLKTISQSDINLDLEYRLPNNESPASTSKKTVELESPRSSFVLFPSCNTDLHLRLHKQARWR
jgi:hypothetical protein